MSLIKMLTAAEAQTYASGGVGIMCRASSNIETAASNGETFCYMRVDDLSDTNFERARKMLRSLGYSTSLDDKEKGLFIYWGGEKFFRNIGGETKTKDDKK